MKKVLGIGVACLCLVACGNYHGKQPVDETYYKRTQGVAWPTEQKASVSQKKATTPVKKEVKKATLDKARTKTITKTTITSETTVYEK